MPKCPHCGKLITTLDNCVKGIQNYSLSITYNGEPEYESKEFYADTEQWWECPLCLLEIAKIEEKAIRWLRDE